MAANVPDPMKREREREQPRLTSEPEPKIDRRFLMYVFKVKLCTLDRCEDPAKCLLKHPGEQGRRDPSHFRYSPKLCPNNLSCPEGNTCQFSHGLLESFFHPRAFDGIGALKLNIDLYARTEVRLRFERLWCASNFNDYVRRKALLKSQRDAIELILHLNSIGRICGYKRNGALLRDGSFDKTANDIAIARAARDAMSKHAYGLPQTTTRIITYFPNDHYVYHRFGFGNVQTAKSSVVLMPRNFGMTSPVGSSLGWYVHPSRVAGGFPDDDDMVEPDDLKLDSGASNHVVGEKTLLHGYEKLARPWSINVADGYPLEVVGSGSIITERFSIPKGLKSNLISVSQLATDHGLFSVFDGRICEVLKSDWREKVGAGFLHANGIYKLSFLEVPEADGGGDENA